MEEEEAWEGGQEEDGLEEGWEDGQAGQGVVIPPPEMSFIQLLAKGDSLNIFTWGATVMTEDNHRRRHRHLIVSNPRP